VQSQALQDVLRRVDASFKNFFARRTGFSRIRRWTASGISVKEDIPTYPKSGMSKMHMHRGKWYVNLSVETEEKPPVERVEKSGYRFRDSSD